MIIYMEQTIALINRMQDDELIKSLAGRLMEVQRESIRYFKLVD